MLRRKIIEVMCCPICGYEDETIEHLFFQCDRAKRIWKLSQLGRDFPIGQPVSFEVWLGDWMGDAPDKWAILEFICILWSIWCSRNDYVFRHAQVDVLQAVKEAYFLFHSICRLQQWRVKEHI